MDIVATGTDFTVRAFADDSLPGVMVREGSVHVRVRDTGDEPLEEEPRPAPLAMPSSVHDAPAHARLALTGDRDPAARERALALDEEEVRHAIAVEERGVVVTLGRREVRRHVRVEQREARVPIGRDEGAKTHGPPS